MAWHGRTGQERVSQLKGGGGIQSPSRPATGQQASQTQTNQPASRRKQTHQNQEKSPEEKQKRHSQIGQPPRHIPHQPPNRTLHPIIIPLPHGCPILHRGCCASFRKYRAPCCRYRPTSPISLSIHSHSQDFTCPRETIHLLAM